MPKLDYWLTRTRRWTYRTAHRIRAWRDRVIARRVMDAMLADRAADEVDLVTAMPTDNDALHVYATTQARVVLELDDARAVLHPDDAFALAREIARSAGVAERCD
ncbi:MAG TPA: hypothetical protein DIW80_06420 [Gordonia polyisoprenivorans]|uniref:hypothetical protein n=1 Tax=Gordonia polyisoprenivorans TaxID=84595 RepID=UPI000ED6EBF9|nr:hypothetical protein LH935_16350 [Gordonia polyisoprenivorans]HCS56909.1 hypothetical protein [Gordonia polyisoprenivorans]